jgi:serine/threonine-protein kinase
MAPEQWTGGPANPQTDIYAATATFFECLTGHPPFRAPGDLSLLRQQHQSAPIPVDDAPEAVRGLLRRGLAKDPANRPRDADVFLRELEAVAGSNYGTEWEEEGKRKLARRTLLLAALFPLALASMSGTAVADSGLGSGFKALSSGVKKALVAAAVTVVIAGGTVSGCVALNPTDASDITTMPSSSPSVVVDSPSPSLVESASPSVLPSLSPSASPSKPSPKTSPSKKTSPSPSTSPSPAPQPKVGAFVVGDPQLANHCPVGTVPCWMIDASETVRADGGGTITLHVTYSWSDNGQTAGGQTHAWSYNFVAQGSTTRSQSLAVKEACLGHSYVIVRAWVSYGRTILAGPIVRSTLCYQIG